MPPASPMASRLAYSDVCWNTDVEQQLLRSAEGLLGEVKDSMGTTTLRKGIWQGSRGEPKKRIANCSTRRSRYLLTGVAPSLNVASFSFPLQRQRMVEQPNKFVKAKLLKNKNGNSRARRVAWSRNKGTVIRFRKNTRRACEYFML